MSQKLINEQIGYIFKRKIIVNPKIYDLEQSLYLSLLEAKIMQLAIQSFQEKKLNFFDATIGDRKCQTRASISIDLFNNEKQVQNEFNQEIKQVNNLIFKINENIQNINSYNQMQIKELTKDLNPLSKYFKKHDLNFTPSKNLKLISLCLFTTLSETVLLSLANNMIRMRKIKQLINHAIKALVCELSIKYEQELAKDYGNNELQKALEQIETKGFCSMTAFFPSFKVILEKIKHKKQYLLLKTILFCKCHEIQNEHIQLLQFKDDQFIEIPISQALEQPVIVIEGYKFPGCFSEFQKKFNIPSDNTRLPKAYYTQCNCSNPSPQKIITNVEEAILAHFAQHPQFTDDEIDIDFKGLGLIGSELQKEYEYLKSLKGYSINDMGRLFITHAYPSKLKDALITELSPPTESYDF